MVQGDRSKMVRDVIAHMRDGFTLDDIHTEVARRDPRAVSCASAVLTHDTQRGLLERDRVGGRYAYRRAPSPMPFAPAPTREDILSAEIGRAEERIAALEATVAAMRDALSAIGRL